METNQNYEKKLLIAIGKIIADLRIKKEMTQEELSKGICIRTLISYIENGRQKIPNIIMISKIAKKLDVSLAYLLDKSENTINDFKQLTKKKIINLIIYGKYNEALELIETDLNLNIEEDYKYFCYTQATKEFYNENYFDATEWFLKGIHINRIVSKTILSYIDIFLLNGYIATLLRINLPNYEKIFTLENRKLLYVLKNSIDYYLFLDIRNITRIQIHLFDYFRLFGIHEVCEYLLNQIEPVIEEYALYELKIDLTIATVLYCIQANKEYNESVNKTLAILKAYDLKELEDYFKKRISEILEANKNFKSSFNNNNLAKVS